MATVKVVLRRSRKHKDGRYPIVIRLTHNKKVKHIFTGHSTLDKEWNGKYPIYLNNNHPNQKELNQYLFQQYSKVNNHLLKLEQTENPFTVYDLHSKTVQKPSPTTLFKFTEDLIQKLIKSGRIGNAGNFRTVLNSFKRFSNGKDYHFEEINYKWLADYEAHHYERGNSPVSLSVYLRALRSIFNKAIKHGIVNESEPLPVLILRKLPVSLYFRSAQFCGRRSVMISADGARGLAFSTRGIQILD